MVVFARISSVRMTWAFSLAGQSCKCKFPCAYSIFCVMSWKFLHSRSSGHILAFTFSKFFLCDHFNALFDSHSHATSDSKFYWLFRVFTLKKLIRASGHLSKENRQLPRNNVVWWSNQQENFPAALQKKVKPLEILFINLPSHLNIFVLKIAVFNSYLCLSFAVKNLILTFPLERIVQKCQKLPSISFRWFYKKLEQK